MTDKKTIWVLPEINGESEEISNLSYGLLSEAAGIAQKIGGTVTALVLGDGNRKYVDILSQYGIEQVYFFRHQLLKDYSAEAYSAAILPKIKEERPWLFLLGDSLTGREVAPRLAALLGTGMISGCAKMDLSRPDSPVFYRFIYGDGLFQKISFQSSNTMLVTMDNRSMKMMPISTKTEVKITVIEPVLSPDELKVKHMEYLPADVKTVDITEADVIVSAGMGAISDDILPLVKELAELIDGSIGTTRPAVDTGKLPRERMIGQTGKVVSPELYIALGISGSSHHTGGIQGAKKIIAVNLDQSAGIFENTDAGVVANLKDVLPLLINKITQAKKDGKVI